MTTEPPLRILVAHSLPIGLQPLSGELEVEDIQRRPSPQAPADRIEVVDLLREASAEGLVLCRLREQYQTGRPYTSFIGSVTAAWWMENRFSSLSRTAADETRSTGKRLRAILDDFSVRLVFLNACSSAAAGVATDPTEAAWPATAGFAAELLDSGIPGVIGMQTRIGDDRAREFAAHFYQSLALGDGMSTRRFATLVGSSTTAPPARQRTSGSRSATSGRTRPAFSSRERRAKGASSSGPTPGLSDAGPRVRS